MKFRPCPPSLHHQLTLCNIKQLARESGMAQSFLQHLKLNRHRHYSKIHINYLSALTLAIKDHLNGRP